MNLTLPPQPPRSYPLIEAFRGRVWRNGWSLYGRELSILSALMGIYALLLDALLWLELGVLLFILSILISGLGTLWVNWRRARLVQVGPAVWGELIDKRRLLLWHELLRTKAHRSFLIRYRYLPEGSDQPIESSLHLCRCAYEHLNKTDSIQIAYHPKNHKKNIPLRVAVMRIPH